MTINEAGKLIFQIVDSGVFGVIFGLVSPSIVEKFSNNKKSLAYAYKQKAIIQDFKNDINGLAITYKDNLIKDLTLTSIGIWSNGKALIEKNDIASSEPITFEFQEDILGDPLISSRKTPANKMTLTKKGKKIIIDFEYLAFEDGAVIQVFHTSKPVLKNVIARPVPRGRTYYVNPIPRQTVKPKKASGTRSNVKRDERKLFLLGDIITDLASHVIRPNRRSNTRNIVKEQGIETFLTEDERTKYQERVTPKKALNQATENQKIDLDARKNVRGGDKMPFSVTGTIKGSQEKIRLTKISDQDDIKKIFAIICLAIIATLSIVTISQFYPSILWAGQDNASVKSLFMFFAGLILSVSWIFYKRLTRSSGQRVIDNI